MRFYDYIVVGGGITGLVVARILGLHGASVLLVEKAGALGGSMRRFRLQGVPFDVGFHFTGGLTEDGTGVLDEMLALLGVRDRIRPIYYPRDACHRILFPSIGASYVVPCGMERLREKLKTDFPRQREGIDRYFSRFRQVVARTPTLAVSGFGEFPPPLDEDGISLQQVLDECVPDRLAQAILGGFCMCYGTSPSEVSFATHARICFGLHESLARVENGGQAFVDALVGALGRDQVDIRTGLTIEACADIENRRVRRFLLSDGSEVGATACIFTIHPRHILATLPDPCCSRAFRSRVLDLEPSIAFTALFGTLQSPSEGGVAPITSIFPDLDLNVMLTCRSPRPVDGPLVVVQSVEQVDWPQGSRAAIGQPESRPVETLTALEVAFPQWTAPWADSTVGKRPAEYARFKQDRQESILRRLDQGLPHARQGLRLLGASSNLTFRDYLNSPDGAAYGIRQKLGQFNVMGRLPVANLYAAGQCALLPGIIGAMTSAFLVCRSLLGPDAFRRFLSGGSCH